MMRFSVLCLASLIPLIGFSSMAENISIAKIDDARVFARYTDDYPAVLNYFTRHTEQQIVDFYQQQFGDIQSTERKRGRLMVMFKTENQQIRVVISAQNNMHQVDILVSKK